MSARPRSKAFSLLELMAVVTLIGVVAAVTMYRLNSVDMRAASETVMKQNVNQLQGAVERYRFDQNEFPKSLTDLVPAGLVTSVPRETDYFRYSYDAATGMVGYTAK